MNLGIAKTAELGGHLVRVDDDQAERVRLDPTTASGYCGVSEDGLFQWGHSKNKRPDLAKRENHVGDSRPFGSANCHRSVIRRKSRRPLVRPGERAYG